MLSVLNLLTLSTISVDSSLAFFAGLRYRQIATLIKSIHNIKATICIVSRIARLCCSLDYLSLLCMVWPYNYNISLKNICESFTNSVIFNGTIKYVYL